jgi:hypothetical protein
MWAGLGLALSVFTLGFALYRARGATRNYYAREVYGMDAAAHRRYAAVSMLFAAAFTAALFVRMIPTVPLLGAYVLIAIFYFSSFARGFSDEP